LPNMFSGGERTRRRGIVELFKKKKMVLKLQGVGLNRVSHQGPQMKAEDRKGFSIRGEKPGKKKVL